MTNDNTQCQECLAFQSEGVAQVCPDCRSYGDEGAVKVQHIDHDSELKLYDEMESQEEDRQIEASWDRSLESRSN